MNFSLENICHVTSQIKDYGGGGWGWVGGAGWGVIINFTSSYAS